MEQKSAEAIVDKDSTTHGGVVAGNEPGYPGWSHPVEGPNLKRGMSFSMSFHGTLNPTGLLLMERVIRNSAPQDNHSYCRLFKELGLEMTGYGPSLFGNRLVRTRMPGGVEAGGEKPPAIRLALSFI